MPELPEVETIARTLRPLIQNQYIKTVHIVHAKSIDQDSLPLAHMQGCRITGTGRRGKLVLLHLQPPSNRPDSPSLLAVHLKMTGRLFAYPATQQPGPHTRVIFDLLDEQRQPSRLFFDDARTFGYVRLISPQTLPLWPFWNNLGPEPLEMAPETLASRLAGKRGSIKSLLLDQTVVAGIGNIYADEALFRAGLDPRRKACTIPADQLRELFVQIALVLHESIRQCGSSIRDYRTARGDAGAFQNTFRVYGRSGQQCLVCQSPLVTLKVAGRTTVCCPRCQH